MLSHLKFLDYSLTVAPFPIYINRKHKITINTINQYSYCLAEKDLVFKEALKIQIFYFLMELELLKLVFI